MKNFFQDFNLFYSGSMFSVYLDWFHGFTMSFLFGVLFFVILMFLGLMFNFYIFKSNKIEYHFSEFLCSVLPSVILLIQMIPSLSLLYYYGLMGFDSALTVKVVGNQWYWSYNYSDIGLDFDSYMKLDDQLLLGEYRLLEVDNRCVLPLGVDIRFCVTSSDVIHSWSIVSMGIKLDAMSGILSTLYYNFSLIGVFYGQCSEICGANHSFMPICLEITLLDNFKTWCLSFLS